MDHRAALANIRRFDQLIAYLRDEMGWPIARDSFADDDDLFFEFTAAELGIEPKTAARIESIKRLRPLSPRQPWGIFFVRFEPKRLPVVALRRILSQVALKKRASANSAERTAWASDDLLFVSNYGEGDERQITFAHFSQPEDRRDLPTLKVLGWDNRDTALHLDDVARELTRHLAWPQDDANVEAWRASWRAAFTLRQGETITTSRELSIRLAELARGIRDLIKAALEIETERGPLTQLKEAFRTALIHDLDADGFADMYAQTIAYGLLSARIADPHKKTAEDFAAHMRTNPFLRELMETFLQVGGRRGRAGSPGIDFDELGVSGVVELLDDANMEAVVRDFGDRNPQEDPVIHFYELFLKEYDAKKRMQRGVFYTPRPVVSYIVRSVDELLRNEFGLADGLADTTTWGEMATAHTDLKIPEGVSPEQDFVQILDPATGTGTFLVEVIDIVRRTLVAKWKAQGHGDAAIDELWNEYVPKHLLTRLHGYELLMAPYAIAHLKVGLKLFETGYNFASDERAQIYLTNALEPASDLSQMTLEGFVPALAHEAHAVNLVKSGRRFTVVIGNPPYSVMSANLFRAAVNLIAPFRYLHGERIIEKGALAHELNLQDDYIKFFGFAASLLGESNGVLGYVSNAGYLASRSLRGMRASLLEQFSSVRILNLGGHRADPDFSASTDENVFDISQGVAISLWTSTPRENRVVRSYGRLTGDRSQKQLQLAGAALLGLVSDSIDPEPPYYKLLPGGSRAVRVFANWPELTAFFPRNSSAMITSRDSLLISFDESSLLAKVERFAYLGPDDRSLERELGYGVKSTWDVERSKRRLRHDGIRRDRIRTVLYRPFDYRLVYYEPHLLDAPAKPIAAAIDAVASNVLLLTPHVKADDRFNHAFVSRYIAEKKSCSHDRSTQVFPLWDLSAEGVAPNVASDIQRSISRISGSVVRADDVLHYVYAILHSPNYRTLYGSSLRDSYPRVPLPRTPTLLTLLVQAGADLVGLHLLDARYGPASWDVGDGPFAQLAAEFVGPTSSEVTSPSFAKRAVWLDKMQTTGFRNVDEEVWNFKVGGYQVCAKWLKDRKGRTLSKDDIAHYQKIVVALSETIRLMKEIDEVIEQHGGWPAAFTSTDAESAEVTHLQAEGPWRVVKAAEEPAAYWSGGSQTDA